MIEDQKGNRKAKKCDHRRLRKPKQRKPDHNYTIHKKATKVANQEIPPPHSCQSSRHHLPFPDSVGPFFNSSSSHGIPRGIPTRRSGGGMDRGSDDEECPWCGCWLNGGGGGGECILSAPACSKPNDCSGGRVIWDVGITIVWNTGDRGRGVGCVPPNASPGPVFPFPDPGL